MARTEFPDKPSRVVNSFQSPSSFIASPFCVPAHNCPGAIFKQRENLRAEHPRAGRGNKMIWFQTETALVARAGPDLLLRYPPAPPRRRERANLKILAEFVSQ